VPQNRDHLTDRHAHEAFSRRVDVAARRARHKAISGK
jgi:hypothetical protein